MGEVVCVVGKTVSDMVCCSHANPLVRALTGYIARQPAIPCLGGAAHARISGPRRGSEVPRARCRARARMQEEMPSGKAAAKRARVRVASTRSEQFRMQFD